ncbi:hypothetical protein Tco_0232860 [Tanacetum coccineum]
MQSYILFGLTIEFIHGEQHFAEENLFASSLATRSRILKINSLYLDLVTMEQPNELGFSEFSNSSKFHLVDHFLSRGPITLSGRGNEFPDFKTFKFMKLLLHCFNSDMLELMHFIALSFNDVEKGILVYKIRLVHELESCRNGLLSSPMMVV